MLVVMFVFACLWLCAGNCYVCLFVCDHDCLLNAVCWWFYVGGCVFVAMFVYTFTCRWFVYMLVVVR